VAWNDDSTRVATASYGGAIKIWDVEGGQLVKVLQHGRGGFKCKAVAWKEGLIYSGYNSGHVRVWNAEKGVLFYEILMHPTALIDWIAVSAHGRYIISVGRDLSIKVLDTSNRTVATLREHAHRKSIKSVAFAPDTTFFVTGSYDETAAIWEFPSGRRLATLRHHRAGVGTVAVSPDGNEIITGSWDGTVAKWNRTGQMIGLYHCTL
jgi:tricorn protease-like protein